MSFYYDRLKALIKLSRPINCLIGGLSVFIAAFVAGITVSWHGVVFAVISSMFITAGANAINDWYDIEIDRINRPERVLPAGLISARAGFYAAIFSFACGIIFSIFIGLYAVIISLFSTALLVFYSATLKRRVLWGNLVVSLVSGLAFIYGALAGGNVTGGIVPALLAFLFHLGREIIKDMEDVAGDAKHGANTLPVVYGEETAKIIVIAVFAILILFTFIPYLIGYYNLLYLKTVVLGVNVVVAGVSFLLWSKSSRPQLKLYSTILKIDMLVGLFAIYIGS
ncbi:MAG: geranylgeranylglycerol-phosphate geranylgeranyltransferase [Deferribacteres bacterium]|nr:geranylgeranylglycerol-phosphate geranylgeranyltransferase [candidate division KSB1 bacterium]MCB9500361.1 geranylgeranylglycerol-phosphate geranylgeranyltransferase [Deferribacteres bacterium]